jgi:hypothetical protein
MYSASCAQVVHSTGMMVKKRVTSASDVSEGCRMTTDLVIVTKSLVDCVVTSLWSSVLRLEALEAQLDQESMEMDWSRGGGLSRLSVESDRREAVMLDEEVM